MVEPKLNDTAAGEPDGPVTVAPVSDEVTELSFSPNGEPAASSATENDVVVAGAVPVVVGVEIVRRPRPVVPSATARSAMTCFRPAWVPLPLRIELASATAGVLMALPENRKRSPAWVLRIPTIEESSVSAFCCPMVWPVLLMSCGVEAASLCTVVEMPTTTATRCWRRRCWC